ncbi:hypothetical protein HDU76_005452, partial [Blyttiomyces sp. JEL0837]
VFFQNWSDTVTATLPTGIKINIKISHNEAPDTTSMWTMFDDYEEERNQLAELNNDRGAVGGRDGWVTASVERYGMSVPSSFGEFVEGWFRLSEEGDEEQEGNGKGKEKERERKDDGDGWKSVGGRSDNVGSSKRHHAPTGTRIYNPWA